MGGPSIARSKWRSSCGSAGQPGRGTLTWWRQRSLRTGSGRDLGTWDIGNVVNKMEAEVFAFLPEGINNSEFLQKASSETQYTLPLATVTLSKHEESRL
jgi:hypothetical protein